jgi:hypothetical protein
MTTVPRKGGTIILISSPSTAPVIQYTPQGQAYFAVPQIITLVHSGTTRTESLTSYFILENGT